MSASNEGATEGALDSLPASADSVDLIFLALAALTSLFALAGVVPAITLAAEKGGVGTTTGFGWRAFPARASDDASAALKPIRS